LPLFMTNTKSLDAGVDGGRRNLLRRALLGGAALASPCGPLVASALARPTGVSRLAEGAPSATAQGAAVLRALHAEDRLASSVARGVRQYVVLGAGLDTFACRNPHGHRGLRVFEVDHPATQRWKRARLLEIGVSLPRSLTLVPVDFETQSLSGEPWITFFEPETLSAELLAAGFRGVDLVPPDDANREYFSGRIDGLRVSGGTCMAAARV
jgi:O-methyltransferase involved in polyketide biosynthesis